MKTSTDVGTKTRTLIVESLKKEISTCRTSSFVSSCDNLKKNHFADKGACSRAVDGINTLILDFKSQQ